MRRLVGGGEAPAAGARLVIKAAKDEHTIWSWQGGYVQQPGQHMGRPFFQRDASDGRRETFVLFYHGQHNCWFIANQLASGGSVSYCVKSLGDAPRPEAAGWPRDKVQQISEKSGDSGAELLRLFVDPEFPHRKESINRPGAPPLQLPHGDPQWIPGRQMRDGPWKLFDGIDPRDLLQGRVGDCWLIAAIAAMAEYQDEVRRLFVRDGLQCGDGKYVVRLFDHKAGRLREVAVDEFMPCKPRHWWQDEAEPYFASPNGNELWCLILEKAMAKVFGSFGDLSGGTPAAAFRALTGEKLQVRWSKGDRGTWEKSTLKDGETNLFMRERIGGEEKPADAFFEELKAADKENFLMAASIQGGREKERADGLVEGHAYSLLQVLDVQLDRERFRLVKLRNPWGNDKEWNGAWSDKSGLWLQYPELKKRLRPESSDDGIFWMAFQDFARCFSGVMVSPKAMRSGEAASIHAAATLDWRSYRPPRITPKPPSHSKRPDPGKVGAAHVLLQVALQESDQPRWQIELAPGQWQDFDDDVQRSIALAIKGKASVARFKARGYEYELDFAKGVQRNVKTGKERPARAAPREAPDAPLPGVFREGEKVHVWSGSQGAWQEDGVVSRVLAVPEEHGGRRLPAGSVQVHFGFGKYQKWVAPDEAPRCLRRPHEARDGRFAPPPRR